MDFFEPSERYVPSDHYLDPVSKLLPKLWRLRKEYNWTYVMAPKPAHPVQGWKIHVSTRPASAVRTLESVTPICVDHEVDFKFASDPRVLGNLLSKLCARSASGKFITIYPKHEASFRSILEALYDELKGEDGPYILSDKRYKDSKTIFYRYGGIQPFSDIDPTGSRTSLIIDHNMQFVEDHRNPYFSLPSFVKDIFEAPLEKMEQVSEGFCHGKYHIHSVIRFSNVGGVYKGKNSQTGADVIIKEARPHIELDDQGVSAVERLKKEFRMLSKLAGTGLAPAGLDFFQEWEHVYMAQEFIPGENLREFGARRNKLIQAHPTRAELNEWFSDVKLIAKNALRIVDQLHQQGIIFGDLSLNNVMIDPETMELRLIDFEGAREIGVDLPVNMYTPGFALKSRQKRENIAFSDDYFGLGCLLASLLMPITPLMDLKGDVVDVLLEEARRDVGVPPAYANIIRNLLSEAPRPLADHVRVLEDAGLVLERPEVYSPRHAADDGVLEKARFILDFHAAVMDTQRHDRLFPAGPELLQPLSLDHGALGVAYAWQRIQQCVPEQVERWILNHFEPRAYLPGLYNGGSGLAWALLEMGHRDAAADALYHARLHRVLFHRMTLGSGAAGYGLSNLNFWLRTQEEVYLREAIKIADILCEAKIEHGDGYVWEDPEGKDGAGVGLMEGGSGIALALLYAYCATGNGTYLAVGEGALRADLSFGGEIAGSLGFPRRTKGSGVMYPYLAHGSAGVGTAVLRYFAVTRKPEYLEITRRIDHAVSQKYSVAPGLFNGLAGLGNYLLDAAEFLSDDKYVGLARRAAEGLTCFEVPREKGLAFPGEGLMTLNTGFASGSSGIALFLHRLGTGGPTFNLMPDALIHQYLGGMPAWTREPALEGLGV